MRDKLIGYETAVLLQKKGYNAHTDDMCYDPLCNDVNHAMDWWEEKQCSTPERMKRLIHAPTQTALNRWLINAHQKFVEIYCNASGWGWIVTKTNGTTVLEIGDSIFFNSYEIAMEAGLYKALNLI